MAVLDWLFPRQCLGCGREGIYFCPTCRGQIKKAAQICPVCERPSPLGQTHPVCQSTSSLDGLVSFFAYQGIIRAAIHELKYRLVTDLKKELWDLIFRELEEEKETFLVLNKFIVQKAPKVIAVPLYWRKENFRGFNQASLIAEALVERYHLDFAEKILYRKKATPSQTKLKEGERKANVAQAFSVIDSSKLELDCLLVDDVWTTGSTLKAASLSLKRAGAETVWGLTLAR